VVQSFDADVTAKLNIESPAENSSIRPLHQNWWPVALVSALQEDRPNAIMALGMRLVLFHDGTSWTCLDDQCAHRFAPLSEGRVIPADTTNVESNAGKKHIQCAYHGWEFDGCGACQRIPQALSNNDPVVLRKSQVSHYPVRAECGIVWIWADPTTASSMAPSIKLPLSPLLKAYHSYYGGAAGFMRDLPYGVEFLGENLADLSHLPFSHHSVGNLRRGLGGPLPFRMMSETEKRQVAKAEAATASSPEDLIIPRYQVDLPNAGMYDPMFKAYEGFANLTLQVGFYEPCHIRYRRTGTRLGDFNVELFFCPLDSGRSRVILMNAFDILSLNKSSNDKKGLSSLKAWLNKKLLMKILNPGTVRSHMMSQLIFDGDGIFLHKQGERMRRSGKTFRNYEQPYGADVVLNAFRRYLDVAAKKSVERGHLLAAASVSGTNYLDNEPRSTLLDRYESHTKYCKICQKGLQECKKREALWNVAGTALIGAAGASSSVLIAALLSSALLGPTMAVPLAIWHVLGASTVVTTAGSVLADRKKRKAAKEREQFLFEDYVHAEKH
jgi:phenylpropionate dioxygenase-like ring-hydroxylating dioxygenase large terminal subunit